MTPTEAADLAARTLAAIDADDHECGVYCRCTPDEDRERVASDLAALREAYDDDPDGLIISLAAYAAASLRRTAALYGVTA